MARQPASFAASVPHRFFWTCDSSHNQKVCQTNSGPSGHPNMGTVTGETYQEVIPGGLGQNSTKSNFQFQNSHYTLKDAIPKKITEFNFQFQNSH